MNKQVYNLLQKQYVNFDKKKFAPILECENDEEVYKKLIKIWGKEHGGIIDLEDFYTNVNFTLPEDMPFIKDGKIVITSTP